jgi:NADPH2:quinone reductase
MPRAVVCRELGPPEKLRLESFASAPLAVGQVRVAIHAAGINFPDILMAAGEYQLKPELPFIPGMEAAGEVIEIADGAEGVAIGDRVIVKLRHGGYADDAVVTPSQLTPLPSTFDYAEGATFLAAHGTAYHALVDRAQIESGEVLLVHGAGGGVGLAAVELGKLLGATVIAAASSEEKLAVAQARGADHLVLYGREPFRNAVKRITDGRGANVVFDPVGGEIFENSLRCIAWGARILVVGFTGGIGMARTNLVLIKGAGVLGVRAGEAARKNPALGVARIKALSEWAEARKIRPNISHRLPLQDYAQAMRLLIERKAIGRVALIMKPVGKGALAPCPPSCLAALMVGTLRFAHPTNTHL